MGADPGRAAPRCDLDEGRSGRSAVDAAVVRAHQHAAGARHQLPADIPRRSSRPARAGHRGQGRMTRNRPPGPAGSRLGRSRGGLTSKIHLAADSRCRPISRVTTAGQRHDSLAFAPVMAGIRIAAPRSRPAPDPTRPGAGRQGLLQPRDPLPPAPTRHQGDHPRTGRPGPQPAAPRQPRRPPTSVRRRELQASATSSNARSTSSRATARSPPATTSATTCSAEPSTSPRSGSGSATPSHDPRDTA